MNYEELAWEWFGYADRWLACAWLRDSAFDEQQQCLKNARECELVGLRWLARHVGI